MTPGCWICDPSARHSDEEACDECFRSWLDYVAALHDSSQETDA